MSVKLKPCPFCGSADIEIERLGTPRTSMIIRCGWCGCRNESSDQAVFDCENWSWNRRVSDKYEKAIREHRDQRGDDRCWMDDEKLYGVLPEGYTPPERDSCVELELCKRFIATRHNPKTSYVSPEREIERLNLEIEELKRKNEKLEKEIEKETNIKIISEMNRPG